ncbi:MAG: hypothetical protein ACE37J_18440 [Pikeienuella sp.]|uniref:hypothetical protein n=1 Tax=Pikeienuella sp. TaxID=2831957 RepID=UPI00391AE090
MPADEIDSLPLDRNLASQEGISTDQMTRVRLAYLQGQNATLVQQTQFADAKAGALLAMIGLIATRGPGAAFDPTQVTAEGLALVLLHASGLLACLIVLIPRYVGKEARLRLAARERYSWPALASYDGSDGYADFARTAQVSQLVVSLARANAALAGILHRKFAWLRAAFLIAGLDLAFIAGAAALSAR